MPTDDYSGVAKSCCHVNGGWLFIQFSCHGMQFLSDMIGRLCSSNPKIGPCNCVQILQSTFTHPMFLAVKVGMVGMVLNSICFVLERGSY